MSTEGSTATGMAAVLASFTTVTDLMGKVWDLMTSNAYLTLFLAMSLLSVGVWAFRKIKKAAKG